MYPDFWWLADHFLANNYSIDQSTLWIWWYIGWSRPIKWVISGDPVVELADQRAIGQSDSSELRIGLSWFRKKAWSVAVVLWVIVAVCCSGLCSVISKHKVTDYCPTPINLRLNWYSDGVFGGGETFDRFRASIANPTKKNPTGFEYVWNSSRGLISVIWDFAVERVSVIATLSGEGQRVSIAENCLDAKLPEML